jgi:hypothetical protein
VQGSGFASTHVSRLLPQACRHTPLGPTFAVEEKQQHLCHSYFGLVSKELTVQDNHLAGSGPLAASQQPAGLASQFPLPVPSLSRKAGQMFNGMSMHGASQQGQHIVPQPIAREAWIVIAAV